LLLSISGFVFFWLFVTRVIIREVVFIGLLQSILAVFSSAFLAITDRLPAGLNSTSVSWDFDAFFSLIDCYFLVIF